MITWIIERYVFDNDDELIKEIKAQGCDVIELNPLKIDTLNPNSFRSTFDRCKEIANNGLVIFRGSLNIINNWICYEKDNWYPGLIYTQKRFKCSIYYNYWGKYLLNESYVLLPSKEMLRKLSTFDFPLFIRPDSSNRNFNRGVFTYNEAYRLLSKLKPWSLVICSKVKQIRSEYRFIISTIKAEDDIINSQIITHCLYKGVPLDDDKPLIKWVEMVIIDVKYHPDYLYILDVGIEEGVSEPKIIELNGFSCSDWYTCDLHKTVKAANQLANEYKYKFLE